MKVSTDDDAEQRNREIVAVGFLTLLGAVVRFWSMPRLGINHFDEGIYAMAGLWMLSPLGLAALDPTTIAYAPPSFSALIGLSYLIFGIADVAAIMVSLVAGTLTIPVVGWVAARTFGRGAGAAAAGLAALAGPHIVCSRMALTDALFLFSWTITLGLGQRFLERPGGSRAILLGVGVGVSQLVKYNGYLLGMIVAVSAMTELAADPRRWRNSRTLATWFWGGAAALISAGIYWPWFQFVQRHGGYLALLAHQRGYLGGVAAWPGYLWVQLAQARVLAGGLLWIVSAAVFALAGVWASSTNAPHHFRNALRRICELICVIALCAVPNSGWWITAFWVCGVYAPNVLKGQTTPARTLLAAASLGIGVLTPFYHPYARLWLPLHGLGWMVTGGLIVRFVGESGVVETIMSRKNHARNHVAAWVLSAGMSAIVALEIWAAADGTSKKVALLDPNNSLKLACSAVASELPKEISRVRLYGRPALTFYLAGERMIETQPSLEQLRMKADGKTWAVLDSVMLRQSGWTGSWESAAGAEWVLAKQVPAVLSLATLLDIEPSAALTRSWNDSAPILLFRPRRPEDAR